MVDIKCILLKENNELQDLKYVTLKGVALNLLELSKTNAENEISRNCCENAPNPQSPKRAESGQVKEKKATTITLICEIYCHFSMTSDNIVGNFSYKMR